MFKIGDEIEVTIIDIQHNGAMVRLPNGRKGFIRKRELLLSSYTQLIEDHFSIGDKLAVQVSDIDTSNNFIFLNHTYLLEDPWETFQPEKSKLYETTVVEDAYDKLRIELRPGITGFIPKFYNNSSKKYEVPIDRDSMISTPEILVGDKLIVALSEIHQWEKHFVANLLYAWQKRDDEYGLQIYSSQENTGYKLGEILNLKELLGDKEEVKISNRYSILLADDDKKLLSLTNKLIEIISPDIQTECVSDLDALIESINPFKYDLIITDLYFEKTKYSGYDLIKKIRSLDNSITIIALSGNAEIELSILEDLNVSYFQEKPIDIDTVRDILYKFEKGELKPNFSKGEVNYSKNILQGDTGNINNKIHQDLQALKMQSQADYIGIFYYNEFKQKIVEEYFIDQLDFTYSNSNVNSLKNSPVTDILLEREFICKNNFKATSKFKNFSIHCPIYNSFIGIPIETYGVGQNWGLFLIGKENHLFTTGTYESAIEAALKLANYINVINFTNKMLFQQKFLVLGQFSTGIIHELKHNFNTLSSVIDLLGYHIQNLVNINEREVREDFSDLLNIKNKLTKKISGISELFKKDAYKYFQLNNIIQNVIDDVGGFLEMNDIHLKLNNDYTIPELGGYPSRIIHILLNLIYNAAEHLVEFRKSNRIIFLEIEYNIENFYPVLIRIKDNGPGINTAKQQRIFDLFYSSKKNGMGLGLFLCKSLANSMGANIYLESSYLYFGTSFCLELRDK